jgi:hypothetical protein
MTPYHLKFKRKTEIERGYSWHSVILKWLLTDMADVKRKGVTTDEEKTRYNENEKTVTQPIPCLWPITRDNQELATDIHLLRE